MRICTRCPRGWSVERAGDHDGDHSERLVDTEYRGLGCETLGLESWVPGVWREAWAGGRQLGVGGWDRKWGPGRRGLVSQKLGRGLYLVGTAAFQGRELRTHMFPVTNLHMCEHGRKRLGAEDLYVSEAACLTLLLGPFSPTAAALHPSPVPCGFSRFWGPQFLWPALSNVLWSSAPAVSCLSRLLRLRLPGCGSVHRCTQKASWNVWASLPTRVHMCERG